MRRNAPPPPPPPPPLLPQVWAHTLGDDTSRRTLGPVSCLTQSASPWSGSADTSVTEDTLNTWRRQQRQQRRAHAQTTVFRATVGGPEPTPRFHPPSSHEERGCASGWRCIASQNTRKTEGVGGGAPLPSSITKTVPSLRFPQFSMGRIPLSFSFLAAPLLLPRRMRRPCARRQTRCARTCQRRARTVRSPTTAPAPSPPPHPLPPCPSP